MRQSEIRRLQMFLALAGFYAGPIDGEDGPLTKAAVLEAYEALNQVMTADELALRLLPYLGTLCGKTYAEAWREAVQQAQGVGILPRQIDRGYVWAIWHGKVAEYQAAVMGK